MRVVLDVSAVPENPAGAGRYIVELARRLAPHPEVDLELIGRRGDTARWRPIGADTVTRAPRARPVRLAWEQLVLPRRLAAARPDVFHAPHYTMPERARTKRVVTIHDLTFFDHPEWHERTKAVFFRRAIAVAARRASALVCVSETTARRLGELFPETPPVHVIPHGVDHERFSPSEPEPGADARRLADLGVRPPYVAFVGTVEPRKDVPSLVRAFDLVAGANRDAQLVVAGGTGWGERAFDDARRQAAHRDRIVRTGFVPDDAVAAVLRSAAVVAYPSRAEGFGLPALEALACGAPLVTTAGTAMAEVAEDAAVLVPPGDVIALADALTAALDGRANNTRDRGIDIARRYTWDATTAAHVEVYRSVLA